jgi:oxysterol-binding protein-related protein 9/10/11
VTSGAYNHGVFVTLAKRDNEEYKLTHPAAYLSGLMKGSLYISVVDTCYVTCPKTRLKAILMYEEAGWPFRSQNKMTGVIYQYDPDNDKYSKLKDVPDEEVLVRLEGIWQEQIYYWFPSDNSKSDKKGPPQSEKQLLIDLTPLMPVPKICPPPEEQLPNESRRFWKDLTAAIQEKRYADANKIKQDIEQRQREKVAERKGQNVEWKPRFFSQVAEEGGQPHLSEEGKLALEGLQKKEFVLKESEITAA